MIHRYLRPITIAVIGTKYIFRQVLHLGNSHDKKGYHYPGSINSLIYFVQSHRQFSIPNRPQDVLAVLRKLATCHRNQSKELVNNVAHRGRFCSRLNLYIA